MQLASYVSLLSASYRSTERDLIFFEYITPVGTISILTLAPLLLDLLPYLENNTIVKAYVDSCPDPACCRYIGFAFVFDFLIDS